MQHKTKAFSTEVSEEGRVCTICHRHKKWHLFNQRSGTTGYNPYCRSCEHKQRNGKANLARQRLKADKPYLYRGRAIRSSMLSRSTAEIKSTTPTAKEIEQWLLTQPLFCYYSNVPLTISNLQVDHKIPVSRGGDNSISNLCIASKHMNLAKGKMTDIEFKQLLVIVSTWEDKGRSILSRLKGGRYN